MNTVTPEPHSFIYPTVLLAFALGGDARLPTGGHTQSSGLEPALMGGLSTTDMLGFLRTRLATVVRVDAATAVVSLHRIQTQQPLDDVLAAWSARTPSASLREAAVDVGRGYARMLRSLNVDIPRRLPRPLAMAHYAHYAGLDAGALATLVSYDDIQSATAALLKLEPLDPAAPVGWLLHLRADVAELVTAVAHLHEPEDIPATSAPLLEQWQADHASISRRLFRA